MTECVSSKMRRAASITSSSVIEATYESEQLKLLARGVTPIDNAIADVTSAGLRVFVDAPEAIPAVAGVLDRARQDKKLRAVAKHNRRISTLTTF